MYLPERVRRNVRIDNICQHRGGCGARLDGMTNTYELLINAVNFHKPKDADRLEPKRYVAGCLSLKWRHTDIMATGEQAGSNPSRYSNGTR
jgi:hypothetical protein